MSLTTIKPITGATLNSTVPCDKDIADEFNAAMEWFYKIFYLLLFIPGLLLNTTALWVLCRHIWKKTKMVMFMIDLALADLIHILSLPLRLYYYFTHSWPFGKAVCIICFYLKYFNMYAAIAFLVCISVQRYAFLLNPFSARRWRRRYDLLISLAVWVVVGVACSPFILMRLSSSSAPNTTAAFTQPPFSSTLQPLTASLNTSDSTPDNPSCFRDLPMRKVSKHLAITLLVFNEVFGFFIPLISISYCSICIAWSLNQKQDQQNSAPLSPSIQSRLQSVTSNGHASNSPEKNMNSEKRRALKLVLSCAALFLLCFAPYHINFMLNVMVSQDLVAHCASTWLAVKRFHQVSLCLASLSCCLNPLLYYFFNSEFRMHFIRTSSVSSSILSSPVSSPTEGATQTRLLRMESGCSERLNTEFTPGVD